MSTSIAPTTAARRSTSSRVPHGDNHGLWIDPNEPKRMIDCATMAARPCHDRRRQELDQQDNQPTAQFYHVISRQSLPLLHLRRAAGQHHRRHRQPQRRRHRSIAPTGTTVGGGESGYIAPDPPDPNIVYAADYGGEISRYDHRTGQLQDDQPWPINPMAGAPATLEASLPMDGADDDFSPHDPKTLYYAGEVLFKTTDGGMHWDRHQSRPDAQRQEQAGSRRAGRSPTTTPASSTTTPSSPSAESPRRRA